MVLVFQKEKVKLWNTFFKGGPKLKLDLDALKLPGTKVTVSHYQTGEHRSKTAEADCRIFVIKPAKDRSDKHLSRRG